ncbi:MAG: AMP-binding protein [Chloroflexi bacterium]|nr:AMP-binding protein [Chloroflexota bacterium]
MAGYLGYTVGKLYDWAVDHYADRVAIVKGERRVTYAQLQEKAHQLGNALLGLGLKKGARIGTLTPNCIESVILDYGLAKAGLTQVILHEGIVSPADNAYMANDSESEAVIFHSSYISHVEKMLPQLKTVKHFLCIAEGAAVPSFSQDFHQVLSASSAGSPAVDVTEDDIVSIYYTGGTTGVPKGCMHASRTRVYTYLTAMSEVGLGTRHTFLHVAPMSHASNVFMMPTCLRGGTQVILDAFNPQIFLETVQRERVTATFIVPTILYRILDFPDLKKYDCSSLSTILYGASPIGPERLKEGIAAFGPVFVQNFGQTEAPMFITVMDKADHIISDQESDRLMSCGKPTLMCQLRLVDEQDKDVPPGEVGEIAVRTPNMMIEYLNKPRETAETMKNGWLHTGDIGRRDEKGFIYIMDRKKDMIISGGWNVYPKEIEAALHEHPAVADVAVIGVPDANWGESVKAFIVLHAGKTATAEQIMQFCKERKGSIKTPKSVEFIDQIPLTSVGKHDKKVLRDKYWKGEKRRVH